MVRKPAKMYRQAKGQPYTRREYMGGVPNPRIAQFDMGNPQGEFPLTIRLVAEEACQIRHNALEAARIAANRFISRRAGQQYHLRIQPFPHIVLRENKVQKGFADQFSMIIAKDFLDHGIHIDNTVVIVNNNPFECGF